jgi:hypothetical protein
MPLLPPALPLLQLIRLLRVRQRRQMGCAFRLHPRPCRLERPWRRLSAPAR